MLIHVQIRYHTLIMKHVLPVPLVRCYFANSVIMYTVVAGIIGGVMGLIIICQSIVIAILLTKAQKRLVITFLSVLFFSKYYNLCTALFVILISC